jgi:hypothetical protein
MANTTRRFLPAIAFAVGFAAVPICAAGLESEDTSRVRSTNPTIRRLVALSVQHSPTFRSLADRINASNGIVFITDGRCSRAVRACVVGLTSAGAARILWIRVDTRRSDGEVIESIAHELQHAVEALSEPATVNRATMYMMFSRIGTKRENGAFETAEAVRVGMVVRNEVARVK